MARAMQLVRWMVGLARFRYVVVVDRSCRDPRIYYLQVRSMSCSKQQSLGKSR